MNEALQDLKDQLPLLLVLTPIIGIVVIIVAHQINRGFSRSLAVANVVCSLLILSGAFWLHDAEVRQEQETRRKLLEEALSSGAGKNAIEIVNSQMARRHAERLALHQFALDGINVLPMTLLIMICGIVCWQAVVTVEDQIWLFPNVLLFQAATLAALMSCDVCVFLIAASASVLAFATILGQWGGPTRRELTARFLVAQCCGGACVMLGFAMLVVAVPWMKIEDSPSVPPVSWNIATMFYEIQKWTSGNPLAFQYQNEVFPWILIILSCGFAIQCGVFPFHSWLIELLSRVPAALAVLFVSGLLSLGLVSWMRFVMPLSPELMVAFDWLVLFPALGSAIWGSVRALLPGEPKRRVAYLYLGLTGVSLLGCFSFSRVAISGMWLMQQQLIVSFCAAAASLSSFRLWNKNPALVFDASGFESHLRDEDRPLSDASLPNQRAKTSSMVEEPLDRSLLLIICLPLIGFFGSGCLIFVELLRENLLLALSMLLVCGLIFIDVKSMLRDRALTGFFDDQPAGVRGRGIPAAGLIVLVFAVVANLFPQQILASIEPDFIRVFQKYEPQPELTAESRTGQRQ